jgi:hypothetical protein
MGVGDQVRSLVAYTLEEGGPVRLSDKWVITNYQAWCAHWNVVPIPHSILLANIAKHPQVRRSRDRLLDDNGRALRNEKGTPLRGMFYTFAVKHAAKPPPKLPGRVPVTDLVPHDPLLSRPRPARKPQQAAPAAEPQRRAA